MSYAFMLKIRSMEEKQTNQQTIQCYEKDKYDRMTKRAEKNYIFLINDENENEKTCKLNSLFQCTPKKMCQTKHVFRPKYSDDCFS